MNKCYFCGKRIGKYETTCDKCYTDENIERFYKDNPRGIFRHYHCDVCGKDYANAKAAKKCERAHTKAERDFYKKKEEEMELDGAEIVIKRGDR